MIDQSSPAKSPTIVVGGGFIGLCCALQLRLMGEKVLLIDIGEPERAASYGNSGQFAVGEVVPLAVPGVLLKTPKWLLDPLGPLTIRWRDLPSLAPWLAGFVAASRWSRVEAISRAMADMCNHMHADYAPLLELAGARPIIRDIDCIKLYVDRAQWEAESRTWALRERAGLQYELLDGRALKSLDPEISDYASFGVMLKGRTYISSPLRMTRALLAALRDGGADVVTGEVVDFAIEGRRIRGVRLKDGRQVPGSGVVIAAGIGSKDLCGRLGDHVPLASERGYHLMLPKPNVQVNRSYTLGWAGMGITPMEEGLRLAGTVELARPDAPPNFARADRLLMHAERLFPGVNSAGAKRWMGHRPSFPDSLPVIDRARNLDNVIYAFGHGHMGVGWAATTGRIVAALHAARPPHIDIAPFQLKRFL
jgi:D-amino-acid dehydrogenase